MKLNRCQAWNFGSYSYIDFDFSAPGLSLIYGSTGSGKSMLVDMPCWALYGVTAKNGGVDEVRSWQSQGAPTKVVLSVSAGDYSLTVTRIRGRSGQNDLYWEEQAGTFKRGKDLVETQRMLNERLGVDSTLYLTSCYFCDFSPSAQFFTFKSCSRRELFEKIASLSLPVMLSEKTSEARKATKKQLEKSDMDLAKASGRLEQLNESYKEVQKLRRSWTENYTQRVKLLNDKINPEQIKSVKQELNALVSIRTSIRSAQEKMQQLKGLHIAHTSEYTRLSDVGDVCSTCLGPQASNIARIHRLARLKEVMYTDRVNVEECQSNITNLWNDLEREDKLREHLHTIEKAERELTSLEKNNPYGIQASHIESQIEEQSLSVKKLSKYTRDLQCEVSRLTRLYDLSFQLRGEILRKSVQEIQQSTNDYLEKYFDSEIKVNFDIESSDNIDIIIQKSGFECSYRQLSKGQRQLLKLCFSLSVMSAAGNSAGVHFDNLFFDEALDGMDDDLKMKAFSLFEDFSRDHNTIMLIDHAPAFQNMFNARYKVSLDSDASNVSVEHE